MIDLEPTIISRLKNTAQPVAALVTTIASAVILTGTVNLDALLDGVFLKPAGGLPTQTDQQGKSYGEEQNWDIILRLKETLDNDNDTIYAKLNTLMQAVVQTLSGWTPEDAQSPMEYQGWGEVTQDPGIVQMVMHFSIFHTFQV